MDQDPQISVISGASRLNQREQIEVVLARAQEKNEPVRVRIPFSMYDYDTESRTYMFIRDAVWNLQLPVEQTGPETIERLIATLGECIVAIAEQGSERVIQKLRG
jgi:hypothetical protein